MALLPVLLLLAVVVTVSFGVVAARRSPPSRETAVAAARAHATRTAVAAVGLGLAAAVYVGRHATGQLRAGWTRCHRTAGTDHLRHRAHARPGRRGAHLATAARRGAAGPARAPRSAGRSAAAARPGGDRRRRTDRGHAARRACCWPIPAVGASPSAPRRPVRSPGSSTARPAASGCIILTALAAAVLWIVANRPAVATEDDRLETALRAGLGAPGAAGGRGSAAGRQRRPALRGRERPALRGVAAPARRCSTQAAWPRPFSGWSAMLAGVVVAAASARPSVPADAPSVPAG